MTYHSVDSEGPVSPEVFEYHLKVLTDLGFQSIGGEELKSFLEGNRREKKRVLTITFDDGLLDHWTIACPLLRKYGYRAIFFVITGRIEPGGDGCRPWAKAEKNQTAGFVNRYMSWDELKEIERLGLGEVHSHTHSHRHFFRDLNGCVGDGDLQWLAEDINRSKREIERYLGRREIFLCWPGGQYDSRALECGRGLGFQTFFTTKDGTNGPGSGTREIKRLHVTSKGRIPFNVRVWLYSGSLRYKAFELTKEIFG
ncbi:MAG: polysaccharide deacetylase family protein [Candidatus Aenigmarchaeota archaeon]|nr:polysaccharide deacetylase family protein [Candidatus Aenigmarchaeota archaeon]